MILDQLNDTVLRICRFNLFKYGHSYIIGNIENEGNLKSLKYIISATSNFKNGPDVILFCSLKLLCQANN